jgi:conjugal transfer pilus assembly protein TraB
MSNPLVEKVQAFLKGLDSKKRANLIRGVSVLGLGGFLLAAYYLSGKDEAAKAKHPKEPVAVIDLGDSRLEDDVRAQVEKERQEFRAQISSQKKESKDTQEKVAAQEQQLALLADALKKMSAAPLPAELDGTKQGSAPDDPNAWANAPTRSGARLRTPGAAPPGAPPAPLPVTFVGDIGGGAPPPPTSTKGAGAAGDGKKNGPKFFLPVSFMSAKLLTGLKAKTVDSAKEDPEPMLLRIQAPAVLPNEVRAQLQGCFVIAHGYGSLASERVESRLVSLSCIDYEGRSVIEQEVTGIVVDHDGVKGLAGRPVTKMGANMARLFVAGVFEGAGDAFESSARVTSVSPLGQTQSIDTGQVGRAALGGGVSKSAGELSKIYAELVRQSAPVIEIGPSKDVSVLLTQGVWLEVKEYAQGS